MTARCALSIDLAAKARLVMSSWGNCPRICFLSAQANARFFAAAQNDMDVTLALTAQSSDSKVARAGAEKLRRRKPDLPRTSVVFALFERSDPGANLRLRFHSVLPEQ